MKRYISISLIIFWTTVGTILIGGIFFNSKNQVTQQISSVNQPSPTVVVLNSTEVAKHNQISNCWIIVSSNVYDVTSYLNEHPGGLEQILPYCGKDATQAFDNKGDRGKPHSAQAQEILQNLYIGKLGQ